MKAEFQRDQLRRRRLQDPHCLDLDLFQASPLSTLDLNRSPAPSRYADSKVDLELRLYPPQWIRLRSHQLPPRLKGTQRQMQARPSFHQKCPLQYSRLGQSLQPTQQHRGRPLPRLQARLAPLPQQLRRQRPAPLQRRSRRPL